MICILGQMLILPKKCVPCMLGSFVDALHAATALLMLAMDTNVSKL